MELWNALATELERFDTMPPLYLLSGLGLFSYP